MLRIRGGVDGWEGASQQSVLFVQYMTTTGTVDLDHK